MRKEKRAADVVLLIVAILFSILFLFPLLFSFISAFKTNGEILSDPLALPNGLYFDSFKFLIYETGFPRAALNSAILTVSATVLQVAIIPMAAYGIARNPNKWTNLLYLFFLSGMMIPFQVYMIPLFRQLQSMGLYGHLGGPIVLYISGSVSFGVLLYTSFLKSIPRDIEEAAEIDGCSKVGIYWRIIFPLMGPVTASMVVLNGLGVWNDFLMPMLVLPSNKPQTIMVEIYKFVGEFYTRWDMIFAGTIIAVIPIIIVFLFLQKYFIKGISSGAMKG
ncbi:raffinose/stachyose/melibiose transport system permease protein [Amphibacillus marinus]|uniref:Raffinose/stachyose/melibiose transport system permease protein n=1 Tax=Amphibacillus marinus TaxID=872970 RepID=A0A1H8RBU7_9BACI|nr:carbohydrate ABC transporter permease [Amphibacillus marinus]SEO63658.1 raffinose/stachyose/melibiose transport system permease protein [Amphibacillus marinus]